MPRPDFKRLATIPIERVCDVLDIPLKKRGRQLRGLCPICEHNSPRAFTVTPALNRFWCHGFCRSGGDVIELVAQVKQIGKYDAALFLADNFNSS